MPRQTRPEGVVPLIGVTGRRFPAEHLYPSDTAALAGEQLDAFFQAYASALARAGAMTVFLPRESAPDALVTRLDGVVLAGGPDVDPEIYGAAVTDETTEVDPAQDGFDLALARAAIAAAVPVLGTCRGHEVLNVALGGTLRDHGRPDHNARARAASSRTHRVCFGEGTLMHALYGEGAEVNSLHHQEVDVLGAGLVATGWAGDGDVVEAIELADGDAVGVQWHPEFHTDLDPVLSWLVTAAARRASGERTAAAR